MCFFHYSDRKRKVEFLNREEIVKEIYVIPCQEGEQKALSSEELQRQKSFTENDSTCLKSPKFKPGICQGGSNVFSQSAAIKTVNGFQSFL